MAMRITGTLVLVVGVLAFAASAYAGGNGNGNGKGSEGAAPGNSGNAPGQLKKDEPAGTPAPAVGTTTAPAPAPTTTAANSTGVKPASNTAHDTHAEAQSDKTKQYGNGQTAGQIAEKNGAKADTVLHGPGNSQPHKAAPCSSGHEVDVHALKSHRSGSCGDPGPRPQPGPTPVPGPSPGPPVTTTTTSTSVTTTTETTTTTKDPSHSDPGSKAAPGQSGAGSTGSTEGVLSATQGVGHAATLPFTGQRL